MYFMTVLHRFKSPQRALPLRDRSPGAVLDILPHRNFRDHQPTGNHRAVMSKRPYPLRSSADRALVPEPRSGGDGTMNTAIATTTTDHDNQTNRPTWRRLALHGVAGCVAATAAVEFYAALGRTAGVAMLAGAPGAHTAQPVTAASFAFGVFICTFWGAVLALLLARVATRPTRAFILASTLLTAVSLVSPLAAAHTAESTKLFLAGGHLLTAAIVIPTLARRLPRIRR